MDNVVSFLLNNWVAGITAVGAWAFGFASDLGKDSWRRKREAKEEHAKLIQKEILTPIYEYMKSFYLPVSELREPPIYVVSESLSKGVKHITEEAYAGSRFVLRSRIPERPTGQLLQAEYWHETEGFKRYYADAKDVHYPELLARWEIFRDKFVAMQQASLDYSGKINGLLKEGLKMSPFSPMGTPEIPWAKYERISFILYKRHLGVGGEGIKFFDSWETYAKTTQAQEEVFKCHAAPEAKQALEIINGIQKDQKTVDTIKSACGQLSIDAASLIEDFRFEISKAPKPRNCKFI